MRSVSCAALDAIANYAESSPLSPALIEPDGFILTYKEVWAHIEAVGDRLTEAGITHEEAVAVLLPQGAQQILAVAGALNHGVCIPFQPRTNVAEVEATLCKLGVAALIVSPEFEAEARAAAASGLTILVAGHEGGPGDWQIRRPAAPRQSRAATSGAILLLITSATTGSSKLVPLTAANLDAGIASRRNSLQLTSADRLLLMTSLCHRLGIEKTFAQFAAGGTVIATRGFDPSAYLSWVHHLKPTWYDCAPTVHQASLVQLRRPQRGNPSSLRFVQSAGAPLPLEVREELERLLGVSVFNDYGMTEAGPIATEVFLNGRRVPNSAGRSCGLEIGIMGPSGQILPPGDEGEIVLRGPAVFHGYVDDPEASRVAFRNGWFRTGDAGRLDTEGNLFVTGRLKEMINRGGEKISPGEVDSVLASHPAVLEAATFAVPHPTLGEDVACAIVLRPAGPAEPPLTTGALRRFAAQRLATFKVPRRIYFVDQIPRGELGKPQRWLLADRLSGRHAGPELPAEMREQPITRSPLCSQLHEIWARILDRDDLGFDEDFFNAGGDSLAAINMLAEVDHRFGSQTSALAASFLDDPTLENLTGRVAKTPPLRSVQDTSTAIRVFPVREGGSNQRLFCVPADGEEGLYFRRLAKHLSGHMDLSIVRPENTWHGRSLFVLECGGTATAASIRRAQPEGPYFIGGFCFGGIIAVEAARQLVLEGQDVRLILFDVPLPGYPSFVTGWRTWAEWARDKTRKLSNGHHPKTPTDTSPETHHWAWFGGTLVRLVRRLAWIAVIPFRRFLVPIECVPAMQRFFHWAQSNYFPFYQARPISAPILHFLSTDQAHLVKNVSRFGWKTVACHGIDEQFVKFDHCRVFHESNLPAITNTLRQWCNIERG